LGLLVAGGTVGTSGHCAGHLGVTFDEQEYAIGPPDNDRSAKLYAFLPVTPFGRNSPGDQYPGIMDWSSSDEHPTDKAMSI